jgi:hypothetical protein
MAFFTAQSAFRFIHSLIAGAFLLIFVFGCIINTAQAAMDMNHDIFQTEYTAPLPADWHTNDHMTIALSLPQIPEREIVLTLVYAFLAITSLLTGAFFAHTVFQYTPYLKKSRVFLYDPVISLFRTGIINSKIF